MVLQGRRRRGGDTPRQIHSSAQSVGRQLRRIRERPRDCRSGLGRRRRRRSRVRHGGRAAYALERSSRRATGEPPGRGRRDERRADVGSECQFPRARLRNLPQRRFQLLRKDREPLAPAALPRHSADPGRSVLSRHRQEPVLRHRQLCADRVGEHSDGRRVRAVPSARLADGHEFVHRYEHRGHRLDEQHDGDFRRRLLNDIRVRFGRAGTCGDKGDGANAGDGVFDGCCRGRSMATDGNGRGDFDWRGTLFAARIPCEASP